MNILFCGGGTAGHINPAIAIAEAFTKAHPNANILFIGRKDGGENDLIKKAGFKVTEIAVQGLYRSLSLKNLKRIKNAFAAKRAAEKIINDFSPNIVIGTGGYVCWPVISAARRLSVKCALHESNSTPGLTSRLLINKCDVIMLGSKEHLHKYKNAHFTGNPLRKEFMRTSQKNAKARMGVPYDKKLIISVGGSIGAEKLNEECLSLMKSFSIPDDRIYHLHSTGERYFSELKEKMPEICKGVRGCRAVPFIKDMATALSAADAVISRCGAMTLAEIAYCEAPAVLVPSPNVTGNHQLKNALYFKEDGAALLIEEKELTRTKLKEYTEMLLNDDKLNSGIRKKVRKLASENSAEKIVKLIEDELLIK